MNAASELTSPRTMAPSKISFSDVRKLYAGRGRSTEPTLALDSLNLDIRDAEIVSIVGPTGCGKSTALNMVAGFEEASSGKVTVDGASVYAPVLTERLSFNIRLCFRG